MKFTFEELVAATGGAPAGEPSAGGAMRIATDTRGLEPGDAFLALRGEHFDGHEFVGDALARGAALAIVARPGVIPAGRAGLVVADTLKAYMALASAARARISGRVIGVTGSTGKTTTKSLLAQLLSLCEMRVAATPQNENNEIGVSKLLLALEGDEEAVVVEMGCRHYGEIAELAAVARPEIGVLTNIGEAHLEIMGTRERIAETKWGLFASGASAILNLSDEHSRARAPSLGSREVAWFGAGVASGPSPATLIPQRDLLVEINGPSRVAYTVPMTLPGDHNLANLAAAAAAARAAGIELAQLARAIPSLVLPPGRYERVALPGGAHLVFDAYNASLSGTLATLQAFAAEEGSRRIAVLGGMAELGPEAPQMHAQIGAASHALGIDIVLAGGKESEATLAGARDAGMPAGAIVAYPDNAAAIAWLRANARAGDAILLKGSRMYKMEEILTALRGGTPVRAH